MRRKQLKLIKDLFVYARHYKSCPRSYNSSDMFLCQSVLRRYFDVPWSAPYIELVASKRESAHSAEIDIGGCMVDHPDVYIPFSTRRWLMRCYMDGYKYVRIEYDG